MNFKKYVKGGTAVFIDAANILYSQKSLGWQVDYKKLIAFFRKNCQLKYIGFYYGQLKQNQGQERFFEMLKDQGYTLRIKPVKYINTPKGTILKGNLDIEIAFDILTNCKKYKTFVILSGDSDFEIVLKYLKKINKQVVVLSTKGHISIELIRNCHKYIDLKKLKDEIKRD